MVLLLNIELYYYYIGSWVEIFDMGRIKEFKVSRAFTIGIDQAKFLQVECERTGTKASALINRWIIEKMEGRVEEIRKVKGPEAYCTKCAGYKEYMKVGNTWRCNECMDDKTELIEGMIRRSKH
jgi:S-adenosylmethionine synthetase